MGIFDKYVNKDCFYLVFRVMVGLLFLQHGLQKLFGAFGGLGGSGQPVELFSQIGLAGLIEFLVGIAIALGLFARLGALVAALEMIIAYSMAHAPNGIVPLVNKGELALLYVAVFIVIIAFGSRKWSLERFIFKKEFF